MPLDVYYLDDEVELCTLFEAFFANPGVNLRTFSRPELLVAAFEAQPPDLLFLDHRLPGTTGEEIAHRLKPTCPVVLISGEIALDVSFPFHAIFHKPYDETEIEALITRQRELKAG